MNSALSSHLHHYQSHLTVLVSLLRLLYEALQGKVLSHLLILAARLPRLVEKVGGLGSRLIGCVGGIGVVQRAFVCEGMLVRKGAFLVFILHVQIP